MFVRKAIYLAVRALTRCRLAAITKISSAAERAKIGEIEMQQSNQAIQTVPVEFNGRGGEYFKISIVNLALSILTLGIYSAWAKVRSMRYFYGNTQILGQSFEYHATGGQILKGRLIAVAIFILYQILASVSVVFSLVSLVVLIVAIPWLVNASLQFTARVSSWRNVHFNFKGNYGSAFLAMIVWPTLALLTVGLLMPLAVQRFQKYIVENHSYGDESFVFTAALGDYTRILYPLMLSYIALLASIVAAVLTGFNQLFLPLIIALFFVLVAFEPVLFNIFWGNVKLKQNGFLPAMKIWAYMKLFLIVNISILLSLGLLYPWARVRVAKFATDSLQFEDAGTVSSIVDEQSRRGSVLAEELGGLFDVDVAIGS